MRRLLTSWSRLPAFRKRLVVEAAFFLLLHDLRLAILSPRRSLRVAPRNRSPKARTRAGCDIASLAWAVDAADRHLRGTGSCLRRAAALASMLRRRGVVADVRIGVARRGDRITAHAWVEDEAGETMDSAGDPGAAFTRLRRPLGAPPTSPTAAR